MCIFVPQKKLVMNVANRHIRLRRKTIYLFFLNLPLNISAVFGKLKMKVNLVGFRKMKLPRIELMQISCLTRSILID